MFGQIRVLIESSKKFIRENPSSRVPRKIDFNVRFSSLPFNSIKTCLFNSIFSVNAINAEDRFLT